MLLCFLLLLLMSETSEKVLEYKYSLGVNPLAFFIVGAGHAGGIILPNPGINFEVKGDDNLSFNFEINAIFPFPIPTEIEVGIREYLLKEFRGFYFYQGIAWGWINLLLLPEERYKKIARYIPNLILVVGYKYVFKSGFTIDPFLGLRAAYGFFGNVNLGPFGIWRDLGVYLGYTW
jgi:hypothetical protein